MATPVYLFTGFLEAGKTKFILETMNDGEFNDGKVRFLIIRCEEGEEEIYPDMLGDNVSYASFEEAERITPDRLEAMRRRAKADVVLVEYNGMWMLDNFYTALPEEWQVFQEIFIADSTTILSYNQNMRQLVVDKLTSCEMVVFNRTTDSTSKEELHKLVRGVSRSAKILYENVNGEIELDNIEDPLPYDIDAPVIEIKDEDFAIFYRDMSEEFAKYKGKTVRFKGICALDPSLSNDCYALGRHIMTCCADDIAYRGVVAKGKGGLEIDTRDWIIAEGTLTEEYSPLYRGRGPVLIVKRVERAEKPDQEVATFY